MPPEAIGVFSLHAPQVCSRRTQKGSYEASERLRRRLWKNASFFFFFSSSCSQLLSKQYRFAEEGRRDRIIFKRKKINETPSRRLGFVLGGELFFCSRLSFFFFLTCLSLEAAAESNHAPMICVRRCFSGTRLYLFDVHGARAISHNERI